MYSKSILAASGVLFAVAAAVPMQHQHHRRDYLWFTEIEEVVVTVPVTETVWIEAGQAAPTLTAQHPAYTTASVEHPAAAAPTPAAPTADNKSAAAPVAASSSNNYVPPAPALTTSVTTAQPAAPTTTSVSVAPTTSVYVAPTTSVYVAPTTSVYVAPTSAYVAPTTSVYVAPASAYVAPAAPAAAASDSSSGSSGGLSSGMAAAGTSYSGDFTYYDVGLGSCGITSYNGQNVVAISHIIFDSYAAQAGGNPNHNPVCGEQVKIVDKSGATTLATVVDRCVGCAAGDLDMPIDMFNLVTGNGDGRVHNMAWSWA